MIKTDFQLFLCRVALIVSICALLNACCNETYAPVINAWHDPAAIKSRYRVQDDDTLYSIACAFELDYRDLARANHLAPPYHLQSGQTLTMVVASASSQSEEKKQTEAASFAAADVLSTQQTAFQEIPSREPKRVAPVKKSEPEPITLGAPVAVKKPLTTKNVFNKETRIAAENINLPELPKLQPNNEEETVVQLPNFDSSKKLIIKSSSGSKSPVTETSHTDNVSRNGRWMWPAAGQIVRGFNLQPNGISNKGIDIGGEYGSPVRTVAAGQVVYSGTGLPGYGNLLIIKHNTEYLTLYGHNSKLLVKEGDYVKAGKQIAKMGRTNSGSSLLHFEVRKFGKPLNPLSFLLSR